LTSLALAVVVRDEADVVREHLEFHRAAGVDCVLATDHASTDGTREVLERYAHDGFVRLFHGDGPRNRQGEWMTRMARLAATELGVDWLLCGDGDEFWWADGGSLSEVLGAVPEHYGTVHVVSQPFVPVREDGRPFSERMTVRFSPWAPINDPATPYRPVSKVAHRTHPEAVVSDGNHEVRGVPGSVLRGWTPIEILHFPLRTRAQAVRKYQKTWDGWEANPRADLARAQSLALEARPDAIYERVVVDGPVLEQGLADGSLVRDTRLRDALASERRQARNRRSPLEAGVLADAEVARLRRHLDELHDRVQLLAGGSAPRRRVVRRAIRSRRS
jgi:Glycosyl transferase family 2